MYNYTFVCFDLLWTTSSVHQHWYIMYTLLSLSRIFWYRSNQTQLKANFEACKRNPSSDGLTGWNPIEIGSFQQVGNTSSKLLLACKVGPYQTAKRFWIPTVSTFNCQLYFPEVPGLLFLTYGFQNVAYSTSKHDSWKVWIEATKCFACQWMSMLKFPMERT